MGIIHSEAAHSREAVYHATFFIAIHRPKLEHPQRKLAVRTLPGAIDQDVERAIHGLEVVINALFDYFPGLVALLIDVHGRKHALGIPGQVARGFKEI